MKLYLISQSENNGYDTFSDAVVCAESEVAARYIHPYGIGIAIDNFDPWAWSTYDCWCKSPDAVKVEYIGEAASHLVKGIVCASFHAG